MRFVAACFGVFGLTLVAALIGAAIAGAVIAFSGWLLLVILGWI